MSDGWGGKTVYVFKAVGWDRFDRRENTPEDGTLVVKTSPAGCPPNGTMGHCFVADAKTGEFIGLVMETSLTEWAPESRQMTEDLVNGAMARGAKPVFEVVAEVEVDPDAA